MELLLEYLRVSTLAVISLTLLVREEFMYLSGGQKFFFFTVTGSSMLLGYYGWGLAGFIGGFVLSAVFLLWCAHRIRSSRLAQTRRLQASRRPYVAFDHPPPSPTTDFEWDPQIRVPIENLSSADTQKAASSYVTSRQPVVSNPSPELAASVRDTVES
jgi:hypothetical protein